MPRFDLDAISSEARSGFDPFVVTVGGKEFTLPSPADLEWKARVLLATDAEAGLKLALGDETYLEFMRARPKSYAMDKMAEAYWQYLGSDGPGESSGSTPS